MPTATAPVEIPTVPPPALPPENHVPGIQRSQQQRRRRCGDQDGDGDLRPILHESCENEGDWQSRPLHKHSRSAYSKAAERGRQIDRYWPDHHYTEVTGTQERHQCNDGIVGHCVTSVDRYITIVNTILVTAVTYLGFEYRSVHDGDRRGFKVKPTAKYVDECLDIVQLRHAKAVMTPLTEQKSLNLHDQTTACGQVQQSLFRAVVGKLQYITGVRPDLMFATKCLSNKLASPTLANLTRAKKVLRYLNGTRELNLYLTIPALKPNDLNKTFKHITGYSDADWAGDPVTRKSTSCTLCYIDQLLLTSECRGQGTVALSSGESEMYALGALSAALIFAQAILEEIGLSFLIHARADSSTARAVATKQGARDSYSFKIFGISETSNDVISQD